VSDPRSHYVPVLDRELHYLEWGERGKPPLVMWHGLARTGRDFDEISRTRVIKGHSAMSGSRPLFTQKQAFFWLVGAPGKCQ